MESHSNLHNKFHIFILTASSVFLAALLAVGSVLWFKFPFFASETPEPQRETLGESTEGEMTPTATLLPDQEITLVFTGDVMPARSVNSRMVRLNNFKYPFEKTAQFLRNADLTIVNLESPLIKNCPVVDEGMVFCGDPRFVEGLRFAGVDVASLANNHSTNYGQEGIDSTISFLSQNGILTTGVNNIVYTEYKGVKFAFLAYNGVSPFEDFISNIDKERIAEEIELAKQNADYIVILFHWGKEYAEKPESDPAIAPFDPVQIARFTIDSGADLIVGNHPHTVWGYEIYKGKPIFYSLGNFIFDQMWSEQTKLGAVLKLKLTGKNFDSFTLHPVKIEDFSQPYFLDGEEKERVLKKINQADRNQ